MNQQRPLCGWSGVVVYQIWIPSLQFEVLSFQFWVQTHLKRSISWRFRYCNPDVGISGLLELTLYLFIESVGSERSIPGPDPSQMLNLAKWCRSFQTKASGVLLVSKSICYVNIHMYTYIYIYIHWTLFFLIDVHFQSMFQKQGLIEKLNPTKTLLFLKALVLRYGHFLLGTVWVNSAVEMKCMWMFENKAVNF